MDVHGKQNEGDNETILGCLSSYCLSDDLADVHFSFPGKTYQRVSAHKMMLAFRSPVFKAMFYGTFPQTEGDIEITDITAETFLAFKRYIYTDEVDLNGKTIIPMLHAAQKYQMSSLLSKCEAYLTKILDVPNACTIFSQAKLFSLQKLQNEAFQFIASNATKCFTSDDFLKLSSENLAEILKLDSLTFPEIKIFQSVLKWTDSKLLNAKRNIDGHSRRRELLKNGILYSIAMPLLALGDFTKIVVPSGILTEEEQLYVFKAITMKDSFDSRRFQFRKSPRKGNTVLTLNIDNIISQQDQMNAAYGGGRHQLRNVNNAGQIMETLTLRSLRGLKIVSIFMKPNHYTYQDLGQNDQTFIVSVEDKIFKGTFKTTETPCVEIDYVLLPNKMIEMEVSFEDDYRRGFPINWNRQAMLIQQQQLGIWQY